MALCCNTLVFCHFVPVYFDRESWLTWTLEVHLFSTSHCLERCSEMHPAFYEASILWWPFPHTPCIMCTFYVANWSFYSSMIETYLLFFLTLVTIIRHVGEETKEKPTEKVGSSHFSFVFITSTIPSPLSLRVYACMYVRMYVCDTHTLSLSLFLFLSFFLSSNPSFVLTD